MRQEAKEMKAKAEAYRVFEEMKVRVAAQDIEEMSNLLKLKTICDPNSEEQMSPEFILWEQKYMQKQKDINSGCNAAMGGLGYIASLLELFEMWWMCGSFDPHVTQLPDAPLRLRGLKEELEGNRDVLLSQLKDIAKENPEYFKLSPSLVFAFSIAGLTGNTMKANQQRIWINSEVVKQAIEAAKPAPGANDAPTSFDASQFDNTDTNLRISKSKSITVTTADPREMLRQSGLFGSSSNANDSAAVNVDSFLVANSSLNIPVGDAAFGNGGGSSILLPQSQPQQQQQRNQSNVTIEIPSAPLTSQQQQQSSMTTTNNLRQEEDAGDDDSMDDEGSDDSASDRQRPDSPSSVAYSEAESSVLNLQ
jgi:hypothetical protein